MKPAVIRTVKKVIVDVLSFVLMMEIAAALIILSAVIVAVVFRIRGSVACDYIMLAVCLFLVGSYIRDTYKKEKTNDKS